MEISVKLPESLYENVSHLARAKKKTVAEFVKNAVRKAVDEEAEVLERPLAGCSDEEVLYLANMNMPREQAERQSELLYKNQADTLSPLERNELESLLYVYQIGNLRKSQGIAEAVLRGLITTPDDLKRAMFPINCVEKLSNKPEIGADIVWANKDIFSRRLKLTIFCR